MRMSPLRLLLLRLRLTCHRSRTSRPPSWRRSTKATDRCVWLRLSFSPVRVPLSSFVVFFPPLFCLPNFQVAGYLFIASSFSIQTTAQRQRARHPPPNTMHHTHRAASHPRRPAATSLFAISPHDAELRAHSLATHAARCSALHCNPRLKPRPIQPFDPALFVPFVPVRNSA